MSLSEDAELLRQYQREQLTRQVTPVAARHVLGVQGYSGGHGAGSFTEALIHAIGQADPMNRAKLAQPFPEYVAAMRLIMDDMNGVEIVQDIAARRE